MNLERYVNEDTHARIYGNIMNMYIVHMQCKVGFTPKGLIAMTSLLEKLTFKKEQLFL